METRLLYDWARLHNVHWPHVIVSSDPKRGRGLYLRSEARPERQQQQERSSRPSHLLPGGATNDAFPRALISVPEALVLSEEAVRQYAKVNKEFATILDATEFSSPRLLMMLYLLVHKIIHENVQRAPETPESSPHAKRLHAIGSPWTSYIAFLPTLDELNLTTLWNDYERLLLRGTSLEHPTESKIERLAGEFSHLLSVVDEPMTPASQAWEALLGDRARDEKAVTMDDWLLVDAWYRSRSLEVPRTSVLDPKPADDSVDSSSEGDVDGPDDSGYAAFYTKIASAPLDGSSHNTKLETIPVMIPIIDMANHAHRPTAFYDTSDPLNPHSIFTGHYYLIPLGARSPDPNGGQICISYGGGKAAAEMLHNYGFVEDPADASDDLTPPNAPFTKTRTVRSLRLPLTTLGDDPNAKAKNHLFRGPRAATFTLTTTTHHVKADTVISPTGRKVPEVNVERQTATTSRSSAWKDVVLTGDPCTKTVTRTRFDVSSPYAYLVCSQPKDGFLDFRIAEQTNGEQSLRAYLDQVVDITDALQNFPYYLDLMHGRIDSADDARRLLALSSHMNDHHGGDDDEHALAAFFAEQRTASVKAMLDRQRAEFAQQEQRVRVPVRRSQLEKFRRRQDRRTAKRERKRGPPRFSAKKLRLERRVAILLRDIVRHCLSLLGPSVALSIADVHAMFREVDEACDEATTSTDLKPSDLDDQDKDVKEEEENSRQAVKKVEEVKPQVVEEVESKPPLVEEDEPSRQVPTEDGQRSEAQACGTPPSHIPLRDERIEAALRLRDQERDVLVAAEAHFDALIEKIDARLTVAGEAPDGGECDFEEPDDDAPDVRSSTYGYDSDDYMDAADFFDPYDDSDSSDDDSPGSWSYGQDNRRSDNISRGYEKSGAYPVAQTDTVGGHNNDSYTDSKNNADKDNGTHCEKDPEMLTKDKDGDVEFS